MFSLRIINLMRGFRVYLDPKRRKNNGLYDYYLRFRDISLHTFGLKVGFRVSRGFMGLGRLFSLSRCMMP